MGGVATNLPAYYVDSDAVLVRQAEYPGTPFTDTDGDNTYANPYLGANRVASNSGVVGINTSDYGTKPGDWARIEYIAVSQIIGGLQPTKLELNDLSPTAGFGWGAHVGFGPGDIANTSNEVITSAIAGTLGDTINRSLKTFPAGEWAWGAIDNP
jgi:hypothetical protein